MRHHYAYGRRAGVGDQQMRPLAAVHILLCHLSRRPRHQLNALFQPIVGDALRRAPRNRRKALAGRHAARPGGARHHGQQPRACADVEHTHRSLAVPTLKR